MDWFLHLQVHPGVDQLFSSRLRELTVSLRARASGIPFADIPLRQG